MYNITVRTQDVGGLYYDEDFTIYGGDTATLRINTTPGTGQWRQTGTTSWNNSGDDLTIPADTNVSIEFNSVSGYDTPGNRTYNVSADSTETDTVVYTPQLGNLRVTTSPTSGQWRLVGSSVWSNSGDTISNIPVGVVQVEFNALVNYDTPANQNVTIAKNITSTANGVYVQHVGSVSVTTAPTSGKWRLVGTSTWRNSGDTVSGVVVGNVDVEFQAIADHDTPANQTLTVTRNATATATGTYIHHTGSLSVTTEPTSGKWRVVGTSTG